MLHSSTPSRACRTARFSMTAFCRPWRVHAGENRARTHLPRSRRIQGNQRHARSQGWRWLLRAVGARLKHSLREGDTVARLGGDEFTVYSRGPPRSRRSIRGRAQVLGALAKPLTLEKQEFAVTASAGLTVYPDDSRNVETCQECGHAVYYAKDKGKNNLRLTRR